MPIPFGVMARDSPTYFKKSILENARLVKLLSDRLSNYLNIFYIYIFFY